MSRAKKARIGFVQTDPEFGEVEKNLARAESLVAGAPEFDVLVLPELFSTGYLFEDRDECRSFAEPPDGPTLSRVREWATARRGWICAGFVESAGDRIFNSCVLAGPDGEASVYRKIHLFDREPDVFDPGDLPFEAVEIAGTDGVFSVGMMICFDWTLPEAARCLMLAGAEVILHPSNLVLPLCPEAMRWRAFENKVWVITANRVGEDNHAGRRLRFTGSSQIAGPAAEVLHRCDASEERVVVTEVDLAPVREKRFTAGNTLKNSRRPEMYGELRRD